MTARARRPNRRYSETVEFVHAGTRLYGSVSYSDDGEIAEVFLNVAAKVGTQIEEVCRDAAVSASLALQHGCPVEVLRAALVQDAAGRPVGAVGRVLDELRVAMPREEPAEARGA